MHGEVMAWYSATARMLSLPGPSPWFPPPGSKNQITRVQRAIFQIEILFYNIMIISGNKYGPNGVFRVLYLKIDSERSVSAVSYDHDVLLPEARLNSRPPPTLLQLSRAAASTW
jgi:hypothetical protein